MSTKDTDSKGGHAVPPDAVRVWRGFRLPTVAQPDFFKDLGTIFIPVTVQMQRLYGLTAYLPSVLPATKAAGVPDEIALVFYKTQQSYTDAKGYVGGRAYSLLHSTIFDLSQSLSEFPRFLDGVPLAGETYHLFQDAADWQSGFVQVFVGTRVSGTIAARFALQVGAFCSALQASRPAGLDGAVVALADGYAIYWEHWSSKEAASASRIGDLATIASPVLSAPFAPVKVEDALAKPSPGVPVSGGECFNTQFSRLATTS